MKYLISVELSTWEGQREGFWARKYMHIVDCPFKWMEEANNNDGEKHTLLNSWELTEDQADLDLSTI